MRLEEAGGMDKSTESGQRRCVMSTYPKQAYCYAPVDAKQAVPTSTFIMASAGSTDAEKARKAFIDKVVSASIAASDTDCVGNVYAVLRSLGIAKAKGSKITDIGESLTGTATYTTLFKGNGMVDPSSITSGKPSEWDDGIYLVGLITGCHSVTVIKSGTNKGYILDQGFVNTPAGTSDLDAALIHAAS